MLMLIKSRFLNIGVDVSYLFEPMYMSLMVNRIIESIDMDVKMLKRNHQQTKEHFVNQHRSVDVEQVGIKIKLSEKAFNEIYEKKFSDPDDKKFVKIKDASEWLHNNV